MGNLTDRAVRAAKLGRHGDGDGLYLVVTKSGRRTWVLRYQLDGVRRDMGLGAFPAVTLLEARLAASEARKTIAAGSDPIDARKAAKRSSRAVPTFEQIATTVISDAQAASVNSKVRYQWQRHLGPVYCGKLLKRPVNEITTVEVAEVLKPILDTKPEVARKLLPAIRRVFEYARVELRDKHDIEMLHNPANWTDLRALRLTAPQRLSRGSHAALRYTEMRAFMAELRTVDTVGARALEFLVLTNVRTDAVLKSKWLDIDLENEIWTVPLSDLKDAKYRKSGFRVPLSRTLVTLLKKRKEHRISNYIFPSSDPNKPLSNQVMLRLRP